MTVSESARADQYCSLIGRALRSGDTQDRFLCRVLLDEQWQSWHSGPPDFLQDDDHFGIIGSVYLAIRFCDVLMWVRHAWFLLAAHSSAHLLATKRYYKLFLKEKACQYAFHQSH